MNIILVGPPGSGKSTIAEHIGSEFGLLHISVGEYFRKQVATESRIGIIAKKYMDKGEEVPNRLVVPLVREILSGPDCQNGFVIDDFPRDLEQAEAFDRFAAIGIIIELDVSDELAIKRISARRQCRKCDMIYGLNKQPKVSGRCDVDNSELYQRDDDKPAAINRRLEVYNDLTSPLAEYYRPRNIVHKIDASGTVEEILKQVRALLV